MAAFDRILVPVDFSPFSLHALDAAVELARGLDARLDITHVFEPLNMPALYGAGVIALTGENDDGRDATRQALVDLVCKTRERHPRTYMHFREGRAAPSIVEASRELGASMVVMGSQGLGGFKRFLLGSVAATVLKQSTHPVLIVNGKNVPLPTQNNTAVPSNTSVVA